jgi:hypothetical protein
VKPVQQMRMMFLVTSGRMGLVWLAAWAMTCRAADVPVRDTPAPGQETVAPPQWEPAPAPLQPPTGASSSRPAAVVAPAPAPVAPAVPKLVFGKEAPAVAPAQTAEVATVSEALPIALTATQVVDGATQALLRDPFWPSDYTPPVSVPEVKGRPAGGTIRVPDVVIQEAEWRAVEKELNAAAKNWGRMPDKKGQDQLFVLIHGKPYLVGDTVSLTAGGKTFRWRIADITRQAGPVFERQQQKAVASGSQK